MARLMLVTQKLFGDLDFKTMYYRSPVFYSTDIQVPDQLFLY